MMERRFRLGEVHVGCANDLTLEEMFQEAVGFIGLEKALKMTMKTGEGQIGIISDLYKPTENMTVLATIGHFHIVFLRESKPQPKDELGKLLEEIPDYHRYPLTDRGNREYQDAILKYLVEKFATYCKKKEA